MPQSSRSSSIELQNRRIRIRSVRCDRSLRWPFERLLFSTQVISRRTGILKYYTTRHCTTRFIGHFVLAARASRASGRRGSDRSRSARFAESNAKCRAVEAFARMRRSHGSSVTRPVQRRINVTPPRVLGHTAIASEAFLSRFPSGAPLGLAWLGSTDRQWAHPLQHRRE